jgi:hypothetical protein
MTTFNAARHGYHFSNNQIQWQWWGPISGYTLCGGMVYSALDYFLNGLGIPTDKTAPTVGGTLQSYIYERQKRAHQNTLPRYGITAHEGPDPEQVRQLNFYLGRGMPIPIFLYNLETEHAHHVLATACTDDAIPFIQVYDPNIPEFNSLLAPFNGGYWESSTGQLWTGFFVDYGYDKQTPPVLNCEQQWRWCSRCQGLFYIGYGIMGTCPSSDDGGPAGPHVMSGSGNYGLPLDTGSGEPNWRWCGQCSGLFFGGVAGSGGICPTGGPHQGKGRSYNMAMGVSSPSGLQGGWRWCRVCQAMYFNGGGSKGICPATNPALLSGFGHDIANSPEYFIPQL